MEKEFVPYEQALVLKELGFNEECFIFWTNNPKYKGDNIQLCVTDGIHGYSPNSISFKQDFLREGEILAPTFSQAFRWFREKHNLFHEIQIDRTAEPKFCFDIFQYEHFGNYEEIRIGEWYLYRTQEEAELECLKELIEIVKRK